MTRRCAAALAALALLLTGCWGGKTEATPALWEVTGDNGAHGYLFGTIHSLDDDVEWRSAAFEQAFAASDTLVVEAAGIAEPERSARIWQRLATTPGQPPLAQRVPAADKADVTAALDSTGLSEGQFADVETWAAALGLASVLGTEDGDAVDLVLLRESEGKRVVDLEGVAGQLLIFDRLPEADQAALLAAVAHGAVSDPDGPARLARLWRAGDVEAIAAETHKGMLADPELRQALLVARNEAWAKRIEVLLQSGAVPFVAVGTAHLAGSDGLPAMLTAAGYEVKRLQ